MKLFEATEQLATVSAWIEEHADDILAAGGALSPELDALLTEAEGTFAQKAEAVALKVRELEAEAAAITTEADRLAQRAKTATNAAASLKDYLQRQMVRSDTTTIKGTLVTVALQRNPPSVKTERDADATDYKWAVTIPESYTWDKNAIKAAAKAGEPLPAGVSVVQTLGLRIR